MDKVDESVSLSSEEEYDYESEEDDDFDRIDSIECVGSFKDLMALNHNWWKTEGSYFDEHPYNIHIDTTNRDDIIKENPQSKLLVELNRQVLTTNSQNELVKESIFPRQYGNLIDDGEKRIYKELSRRAPVGSRYYERLKRSSIIPAGEVCIHIQRPYIDFIVNEEQTKVLIDKLKDSNDIGFKCMSVGDDKPISNDKYDDEVSTSVIPLTLYYIPKYNIKSIGARCWNEDVIQVREKNILYRLVDDHEKLFFWTVYYCKWGNVNKKMILPEGPHYQQSDLEDPDNHMLGTLIDILKSV